MIIVITKLQQAAANAWCKANIDAMGGEFTFTVPLFTGNTHTHYWASFGSLTDEQLADMDAHFPYTYDYMAPDEVLEKRGLNTGPQEWI